MILSESLYLPASKNNSIGVCCLQMRWCWAVLEESMYRYVERKLEEWRRAMEERED